MDMNPKIRERVNESDSFRERGHFIGSFINYIRLYVMKVQPILCSSVFPSQR